MNEDATKVPEFQYLTEKIAQFNFNPQHVEQHVHLAGERNPSLPSNIPSSKGFIGRESELSNLHEAIQGGRKAFVLHGLGGVGKTDLALQFIDEVKAEFEARIRVDMRGLDESALSSREAMLEVIRAFEPNTRADLQEYEVKNLYNHVLHHHKTLILLDNAKDRLQVEPLNNSTTLTVITTRSSFNVTSGISIEVEQMSAGDAIKLLYSIADEDRFEGKADVLAAMSGYLPMALLPLASTLAEDVTLEVDELIEKYKNRQELLRLADPNRENLTIEASFDLTYELLDEETKERWRKLAVFPADFDLEAIEAVWRIADAREVRSELVKRHLVIFNKDNKRIRLHDLVHDYTNEKLTQAERLQVEWLFALHYAGLLTKLNKVTLENLAKFDLERKNIEAGFAWVKGKYKLSNAVATTCLGYTAFATNIFLSRYPTNQLIEWTEVGLAAARHLNEKSYIGIGLVNLATAYFRLGETQKAIEYYKQALAFPNKTVKQDDGSLYGNLGTCYVRLGETDKAIEHFEKALKIAKKNGDKEKEASWLNNLGGIRWDLGERQAAKDLFEKALAIASEIRDRQGEGTYLANLGNAYRELGQVEKAIKLFEDSLLIAREIGDRKSEGIRLGNLGVAYKNLGGFQNAIKCYEEALNISKEIGDPQSEATHLANLANIYTNEGNFLKAIELLENTIAISKEIGYLQLEARALGNLGDIHRNLGQFQEAVELYERGLDISRKVGDRQNEATILCFLGTTRDTAQDGISCYEQALEISRAIGDKQIEGICLSHLGVGYGYLGENEKAKVLLREGIQILKTIKSPYVENARYWLSRLE
jgi:tetratricopeptide (TPR) repeat protein